MPVTFPMKLALQNLVGLSLLSSAGYALAQPAGPVERLRADLLRGEAPADASPALKEAALIPRMLEGEEIKALLSGNTLRRNHRLAIYFAPGGSGSAWGTDWVLAASVGGPGPCPSPGGVGDAYDGRGGVCRRKSIYTVSHRWWIDADKLCQQWTELGVDKHECWRVAVLYDRVLLFKDTDDSIEGVPMDLRAGQVLAQAAD